MFNLGVLRYTGIDDNRNIQSNNLLGLFDAEIFGIESDSDSCVWNRWDSIPRID